MKKILLTTIASSLFAFSFAGGLLTNTNQNVHFLRNPARDASTSIDAVYSNPAGLAFMKENGFHLSFNGQSAFQTRTITSTFKPFESFGGSDTKKFEGEASAPFIPSLQAAYKNDKWVFSGSFAVTGGGGKATFNDGLGSFESMVALIPTVLSGMGVPTSQYSVNSYMEGSQMIFGLQLGATYKINDYLSAFGGVRMNYVKNGYVGHIKDIKINAQHPLINPNADMISASDFFTAANNPTFAALTADKYLDCDQTGWGVTPILGMNFNWKKLNVGVKYEFNTHLNVENKTKVDDTGRFSDGVNTPHDIPALFTAGVSFEILPVLTASVGYHHFFDKQAKMADDKQKHLSSGTNEYIFGLEWDVLKWLQLSAGFQRTEYGLEDGYMSDMSFTVSSFSYGVGAGFKLTEKLNLNVAYFWTDYDSYTKNMSDYNNIGATFGALGITLPSELVKGKDVFTRTNKVFGIGLDYRF